MTVKTKTPLEEYLSLPEGYPAELIGGEIVVSPSPSVKHQEIAGEIFWKLKKIVDDAKIGKVFYELDVHIDDENVLRPDVIFISSKRKEIIKEDAIKGTPDIVVEVSPPSTASRDMVEKRDIYERAGVKEYWIVDIEGNEIYVLINENSHFKIACKGKKCTSEVLEGFEWGFEK